MTGTDLEALAKRASEAARARRLDEAATLLEQILETDPDHLNALDLFGFVRFFQGRYAEAVELFQRVTRMEPGNARAFNNLAYYAAIGGGDLIEAERAARRAVDLDPQPNYLDSLGFVLIRREKWDEAQRTLAKARKGDPASMEILLHLGMAQAGAGQPWLARGRTGRPSRAAAAETVTCSAAAPAGQS